ncbi:MAG TPA: hypothetical protein VJN42_11015 [Candidatus Acidoferrum sp.]|nr:hypothetical protein [Candidatus Acidoferrum sp.]
MESFNKKAASCEETQAILFDLDRDGAADSAENEAAILHLAACPRCAALQESWQTAKEELRVLSEEAVAARAPDRVEMRLRQEFRMQHQSRVTRRGASVAAWALAAAAVLIGAVSVWNWQHSRIRTNEAGTASHVAGTRPGAKLEPADENLASDNATTDDAGEFTPLPGAAVDDSEEEAILRVRMQRESLVALGLPVNEQRAGDWIQVDLLVGSDGLPEGVRLAQEGN